MVFGNPFEGPKRQAEADAANREEDRKERAERSERARQLEETEDTGGELLDADQTFENTPEDSRVGMDQEAAEAAYGLAEDEADESEAAA